MKARIEKTSYISINRNKIIHREKKNQIKVMNTYYTSNAIL